MTVPTPDPVPIPVAITRDPGRTLSASDSGISSRTMVGPAVMTAIAMPGATGDPAGTSARSTRPVAGAITVPCPATAPTAACWACAARIWAAAAAAAASA